MKERTKKLVDLDRKILNVLNFQFSWREDDLYIKVCSILTNIPAKTTRKVRKIPNFTINFANTLETYKVIKSIFSRNSFLIK